ncbi:MAG: radical SAM protein [Candidatus Methanoperedens sp.]|nr:radical SAM protein [Candidatus Methanoperedens sp.]
MKVLIINPPVRLHAKADILPWGLVYIAQSMLDEGHDVTVLDVNANRWSDEEMMEEISKIDFEVVAIGGIITVYSYLKWVTLEIRKRYPAVPIIAGGFVAAPMPELIFSRTGANIICYGEGDITIKELLKALETGGDLKSVNGLYLKEKEGFIQTPPRQIIKNLDDIPIPKKAYEKFPMEIYLRNGKDSRLLASDWAKNKNIEDLDLTSFTLLSGRGCTHNCTFCYRMIKGMRKFSSDYMIEHITFLKNRYGVNNFIFSDELFVSKPEWVNEFCDKIISNNLNINFRTYARANSISKELLDKMKKAGCFWLSIGFESGSQRMLDSMNKKIDVRKNYEAVGLIKDAGINLTPTFIIGLPGEQEDTLEETREFIQKTGIDEAGTFYATPYPGSMIYDFAIEKGLIKNIDQFIESLDDADRFTINLTDLKDGTLMKYMYLIVCDLKRNKNNRLKKEHPLKGALANLYLGIERFIYTNSFTFGLDGFLRRLKNRGA